MPADRLQKVLAAAGVGSRRASEALIAAGRVTVDGRPAVLGERVDPATTVIAVDGRPIGRPDLATGPGVAGYAYLALHKPIGVTSTVRDPHARRTVLESVPAGLVPPSGRLFPVGRLDRDSEGLLLLTDDGGWAERVLHPRYGLEREYAVALWQPLDATQVDQLRAGIDLEEGSAAIIAVRPASRAEDRRLEALLDPPSESDWAWYRLTLGQGRKRQVRRMLGAVGAPVARLVRVRIGPLRLEPLRSAEVRRLRPGEVEALRGGRA